MLVVPKKLGTYTGDSILGNLVNCGENFRALTTKL